MKISATKSLANLFLLVFFIVTPINGMEQKTSDSPQVPDQTFDEWANEKLKTATKSLQPKTKTQQQTLPKKPPNNFMAIFLDECEAEGPNSSAIALRIYLGFALTQEIPVLAADTIVNSFLTNLSAKYSKISDPNRLDYQYKFVYKNYDVFHLKKAHCSFLCPKNSVRFSTKNQFNVSCSKKTLASRSRHSKRQI